MLIMMISDPPLPMPKVVIWSASHMTNSAAEVMPMTVIRRNPNGEALVTICTLPSPRDWGFSRTVAIVQDCTTQMTIVR